MLKTLRQYCQQMTDVLFGLQPVRFGCLQNSEYDLACLCPVGRVTETYSLKGGGDKWSLQYVYIADHVIKSNSLKAMTIPKSVERIYENAFECPKLKFFIIPDGCKFDFHPKAFVACAKELTFSVETNSPMIPILKRYGYTVWERPENTMEDWISFIMRAVK